MRIWFFSCWIFGEGHSITSVNSLNHEDVVSLAYVFDYQVVPHSTTWYYRILNYIGSCIRNVYGLGHKDVVTLT